MFDTFLSLSALTTSFSFSLLSNSVISFETSPLSRLISSLFSSNSLIVLSSYSLSSTSFCSDKPSSLLISPSALPSLSSSSFILSRFISPLSILFLKSVTSISLLLISLLRVSISLPRVFSSFSAVSSFFFKLATLSSKSLYSSRDIGFTITVSFFTSSAYIFTALSL